jgi:hypothetical protein
MAYPTTIFSGSGINGYQPPVKSTGGDFYQVVAISATAIDCYKSSDPEDGSWSSVDVGANNPAGFTDLTFMTYTQDSDDIHVCTWDESTDLYEYHRFDMSTDTWDEVDSSMGTYTDSPDFPWASVAIRSDGDIVCFLSGETDTVSTVEKNRVDFIVSTDAGVTWSTPSGIDGGGNTHYGIPNAIKGPSTDDIHFIWERTTNTSNNPPTSWRDVEVKTLRPDDSTSSRIRVSTDTGSAILGIPNAVSYDDLGTNRIAWNGAFGSASISSWRSVEDGSNDIDTPSQAVATSTNPFVNSNVAVMSLSEDEGELHCLFSNDEDSQDIYYITSTDDGATWTGEIEEVGSVTCNYISSEFMTINGANSLAFSYDDGGVIKFNAKSLGSLMQWKSGQTTTGSGGNVTSMVPLLIGDPASGATVKDTNTTKATAGTIVTHYEWYWNVRIPFQMIWTPETRPILIASRRATLELATTPGDTTTFGGYVVYEELG